MNECPYAKSDMTPCVLKDGDIYYAMNSFDKPICVGCERSPQTLGREPPANWERIVEEYKRRI